MKKRKIFALVVSLAFLVLIFYKIDLSELVNTFKNFDCKNLIWIVLFYVLSLCVRGVRWKALLLNDSKYSSLGLAEIFTVGSMLNVFLPARAGDVYRAYYLGTVKEERKMKVLGSIILERIFDGICVFLILLFAVLMYCRQKWILQLSYGIGALFIGALLVFYLIYKFDKIDWIFAQISKIFKPLPEKFALPLLNFTDKVRNYMNSFMQGFQVLDSLKYTLISLVSSFIVWGLEAYVAYLIVDSFDLGLRFAAALFVISLTSFSTMIPSTSVFLGPYQYAYILALGIFSIEKSTSLAVSAIHQAIYMIILTVLGGYYLLKCNISIKDIEKAAEDQNKD